MADKYVTLHPTVDGELDTTTNIYPNVKASQNVLKDDGTRMTLQEKLTSGVNIKTLKVGSSLAEAQSLLGSDSIIIDFLNLIYPIGSIYMCDTNATVSTTAGGDPICPIEDLLGGSWTPIYDMFLYAAKKGTHAESGDYYPGDSGGSKDAVLVEHNHGGGTNSGGIHNHETMGITGPTEGTLKLSTVWAPDEFMPSIVNDDGTDGILTTTGKVSDLPQRHNQSLSAPESQFVSTAKIDISGHDHTISDSTAHYHVIESDGEAATGKNMPPYKAIYAWKRVS